MDIISIWRLNDNVRMRFALLDVGSGLFLFVSQSSSYAADVIAENQTIGRGDREKKPRVLG